MEKWRIKEDEKGKEEIMDSTRMTPKGKVTLKTIEGRYRRERKMIGSGEAGSLCLQEQLTQLQYPTSNIPARFFFFSFHQSDTSGQLDAKLSPFAASAGCQNLLRNRLFQSLAVSLAEIVLDLLQMLRLPVKPYQPRDQQLRPFSPGPRLMQCLVQEQGVAHGTVDNPVENMSKCFALFISLYSRKAGEIKHTTKFCDFAIIALAKFLL